MPTVPIIITGSGTSAVAAFEEVGASAKTSAATTKAAMADASAGSTSLTGALSKVGVVGGAALLGAGVEALHLADSMDKATNSIAANAGISQASAKKIGDAFLQTGGQTIFTGIQMAQAFATVAGQLGQLNGKALTTAQALTIETSAATLAEAAHVSLGAATSSLAGVLGAFHQPISAATEDINILYKGGVLTGMGVEGLSASIAKFAAGLGAVKPPLSGMVGLIDDLVAHGETGRKAVSAITTGMTGLVVPTAAATKAQKEYNVTVVDAQGKMLPLTYIIGELQRATDGMGTQQALATLKALGLGTASLKLLDTIRSGPAALQAYTDAVSKHGAAALAAQKSTANLDDEFKKAKAAVEDLVTEFGQKLLPVITTVISKVAEVVQWFEQHRTAAIALGAVIGGVLTVAIGLWTAGLVSNAAAMLASVAPATAFGSAMTSASLALSRVGPTAVTSAATTTAAMTDIAASADAMAADVSLAAAKADEIGREERR